MKSALTFAASKPRYKKRPIDWYSVWEEFHRKFYLDPHPPSINQQLFIERLVNRQLTDRLKIP